MNAKIIQHLKITNFKSIKEVDLTCKKLNVFIGEPNSGKSNILEAMALQSQDSLNGNLRKDIFRYKTIGNLFYDFNINRPIEVATDQIISTIYYDVNDSGSPTNQFLYLLDKNSNEEKQSPTRIRHDGEIIQNSMVSRFTNVRYYEFKKLDKFQPAYMPNLSVPYGDNLPGLLLANSDLKEWVTDFFRSKGFYFTLNPIENEILLSKLVNDNLYSYPYFSISETLQRIVFYIIAIKSNINSVLLLDEPESNTFPFYTKYLAEQIALDESNQFFISTHNPYLLLALIEKSRIENLNVCIVRMENYETKVQVLNEKQINQVLDFNSDVFFNFDNILSL